MAKPEVTCVVDAKAKTGEGPFWDVKEQALYWVDIPQGRLYRFDPATGENRMWEMGEPIGCMAIREQGGAIMALRSGFWFFDFETGRKTKLFDPEEDKPQNRFNDGATDPKGRFWAGTMKMEGEMEPVAAFYRLDLDLSYERYFDGLCVTNGCAFAPDGGTMYFSDSYPRVRTIWACDYDLDSGRPTNRRIFFDTRAVAGRPDGGTVDADGCYWMAGVSGWQLVRITPKGEVDRVVDMPVERPTKPMFGGKDLDVLYVTSIGTGLSEGTESRQPQAGGLFAVSGLGIKGVPQARFAG